MKTVTSTILLATTAVGSLTFAAPKVPTAKLLDMYAVREGDSVVVHVLANGDISHFLSDRKTGEDTYKLTLDVPALSPMDTKYDVETPFSRRFQVWPMQLGKKIYSRIELELDLDASSVVGILNASHLFVRIQRDVPMPRPTPAVAKKPPGEAPVPAVEGESEASPVQNTALGALPVDAPASDGGSAATKPVEPAAPPPNVSGPTANAEPMTDTDEELFYSLFPTPARQQQTLFNVATDDIMRTEEGIFGIRAGRFNVQPFVDFSWIRGDNLLLATQEPFVDHAYLVRGRLQATLLDSVHQLKLAYEGRYRDFRNFTLEKKYTHVVDVQTVVQATPSTSVTAKNHFVSGSFESQEFDPGGEVVASTDPFYRNLTQGVVGFALSERFGTEINASYNVVEFLQPSDEFFDYDTRSLGATFLYNLSPLTSLLGEYSREVTPEPVARPQATAYGDTFLFGLRGELTPMMRGQIRAGYSIQHYDRVVVPQDFSGFVADVNLTRDFGETASLQLSGGRGTFPSAFHENGYYVSNYGRLQFITPFARNFRLTASSATFFNNYPVADATGTFRRDDIFSAGAGVAYFFTPITYLSFDYRHDRRNSNLSIFEYRNSALQLMVGFGFLNR